MMIVEGRRRPEWAGLTKLALRRYPNSGAMEALHFFISDRRCAGLGALSGRLTTKYKTVRRLKYAYGSDVIYELQTQHPASLRAVALDPLPGKSSLDGFIRTEKTVEKTFAIRRSFDRSCLSDQEGRDWLACRLRDMRRELQQALLQSNTVVK